MEKRERPAITKSYTIRTKTGCGNLYVTVGRDNGSVIEIFASLGKAGHCPRAQLEAITRAITLGVKFGIPIKEFVEEFRGIRCQQGSIWEDGKRTLSCADAIAKVLESEAVQQKEEYD